MWSSRTSPSLAAAGLWIAVHLLLILLFGWNVTRFRLKLGVGTGHGDNADLERAVRAHGNATEHVPGLLIGLALVALLGATATLIHGLGASLFVARLLHAYGIQDQSKRLPPTRVTGNVITWLVTLILCGTLIWQFVFHANA